MKLSKRRAIDLWTLGFLQAGLILAIMPKRFAKDTAWEASPWQREIAIWNAGTISTVVALRRKGGAADTDAALGTGFTILSGLFAANHIATIRRSPTKPGHWLAAGANLAGIGLWLLALLTDRD